MLLDILQEHLDEAEWLFARRQAAFGQLDMTVADLAAIDARLRAHLDGLLVDPAAAWELCAGWLVEGTESQAFVAGIVALEGGDDGRREELVRALAAAPEPVRAGVRHAAALTVWDGVEAWLPPAVQDGAAQSTAGEDHCALPGVAPAATALLSIGHRNNLRRMDELISALSDPELATFATAAIRHMLQAPDDLLAPPEADSADDAAPSADDGQAVLDAARFAAWWQQASAKPDAVRQPDRGHGPATPLWVVALDGDRAAST